MGIDLMGLGVMNDSLGTLGESAVMIGSAVGIESVVGMGSV